MAPNFTFCAERLKLREDVVDATTEFARRTRELIATMGMLPRDVYKTRLEGVDRARDAITKAREALLEHERTHRCYFR